MVDTVLSTVVEPAPLDSATVTNRESYSLRGQTLGQLTNIGGCRLSWRSSDQVLKKSFLAYFRLSKYDVKCLASRRLRAPAVKMNIDVSFLTAEEWNAFKPRLVSSMNHTLDKNIENKTLTKWYDVSRQEERLGWRDEVRNAWIHEQWWGDDDALAEVVRAEGNMGRAEDTNKAADGDQPARLQETDQRPCPVPCHGRRRTSFPPSPYHRHQHDGGGDDHQRHKEPLVGTPARLPSNPRQHRTLRAATAAVANPVRSLERLTPGLGHPHGGRLFSSSPLHPPCHGLLRDSRRPRILGCLALPPAPSPGVLPLLASLATVLPPSPFSPLPPLLATTPLGRAVSEHQVAYARRESAAAGVRRMLWQAGLPFWPDEEGNGMVHGLMPPWSDLPW
ncbi:hypothetical protein Ct61P_14532 [Colletotrichum tofieldiae]|nr:hypothetical protein Ct61P_14532 [Colletotrichum tofieldiae]